jgi:hypothetical protein
MATIDQVPEVGGRIVCSARARSCRAISIGSPLSTSFARLKPDLVLC